MPRWRPSTPAQPGPAGRTSNFTSYRVFISSLFSAGPGAPAGPVVGPGGQTPHGSFVPGNTYPRMAATQVCYSVQCLELATNPRVFHDHGESLLLGLLKVPTRPAFEV